MQTRGAEVLRRIGNLLRGSHDRSTGPVEFDPRNVGIELPAGTYEHDLKPLIGTHFRDESGLYVVRIMNAPAWPNLDFIEVIHDARPDIWHAGTHLNAYVKPDDQIDPGMWSITLKEDDDTSRWGSKEEFLNEFNRVIKYPLYQLPLTGMEALES